MIQVVLLIKSNLKLISLIQEFLNYLLFILRKNNLHEFIEEK